MEESLIERLHRQITSIERVSKNYKDDFYYCLIKECHDELKRLEEDLACEKLLTNSLKERLNGSRHSCPGPDRMGGQFTAEEIEESRTWR